MRKPVVSLCAVIGIAASLPRLRSPAGSDGEVPDRFQAVDTASLTGSPDALPRLDVGNAFPRLRFRQPLRLRHSNDATDRLFVAEQRGRVLVFPNDRSVRGKEVFLDLGDVVHPNKADAGLMDFVLHPAFGRTRELFVIYVTGPPMVTVLSSFVLSRNDPDRVDRSSERVLLRVPQPFNGHKAACLEFGPDGYLYVSIGAGGWGKAGNPHPQDPSTLLGTMLRIDVAGVERGRYRVPPDNPFLERTDARPEVWCYGLRAPWRFSFDPLTGTCWLGDNGQDGYEEVDIIERGRNYGWNVREGMHPLVRNGRKDRRPTRGFIARGEERPVRDDPYADPVLEYSQEGPQSVVGGLVYRGARFPELHGAYLYADFRSGDVWALRWDGEFVTRNERIVSTRRSLSSFARSADGEVLLLDLKGHLLEFVRRAAPDPTTPPFPVRLSQTGLFSSIAELEPAPGLIPYSVNVPLWSDGARKDRYLGLPRAGSIRVGEDGDWQLPLGSVLVKTFSLEGERRARRLETRLFVHAPHGWAGYTYVWNDAQDDALLLDESATKTHAGLDQEWYYPSRDDCFACHTDAAGFTLGLTTRQLNRDHDYGRASANQIAVLDRLGVFETPLRTEPADLPAFPDWTDPGASAGDLARAYLDVNCAVCHRPPSSTRLDLRYATPLDRTWIVDHPPEEPRIGPEDSRLVAPGLPQRSELLLRMVQRETGPMPPLASNLVDTRGCAIVREWIRSLEPTSERSPH